MLMHEPPRQEGRVSEKVKRLCEGALCPNEAGSDVERGRSNPNQARSRIINPSVRLFDSYAACLRNE